jgi:hypothetical protein
MKQATAAIITLMIVFTLAGPASAEHTNIKDYQLGSVPFGKEMEEVLKDFEGTDIKQEETPFIESIANYALDSFFEGGVQKSEDRTACFYPQIVQKYTVTGAGGSGVKDMTLYFQGFQQPERPFSLFMLKKTYAINDGLKRNLKNVFDRWAQPIIESIGTKPEVRQGTFQDFSGQVHDYFRPTLVGIWDMDDKLVFLMIADSNEGPSDPEVVIVDKEGLKTYIDACKIIRDGG